MRFPRSLAGTSLAVLAMLGLCVSGCSPDAGGPLNPNLRPTVTLTQAPVRPDTATRYFYAYRVNWSGYDRDGRVDRFEYAIDPPSSEQVVTGRETTWVRTTRNEEILFFRAAHPDTIINPARPLAADFHEFVIRAVDNSGAFSAVESRAFYAYTVAPEVVILNPAPKELLSAEVTPSVRITWSGRDPDGQFSQKPIQYKYILISESDPDFRRWKSKPNELRKYYDALNFAGWDSVGGDTTSVRYTNLTPGSDYLFVVIGYDEAGAYSPIFNLNSNMLLMSVGFASTNGPKFTVFNDFFNYTYNGGGYTTDDLAVVKIEVPSDSPFYIGWFAEPPPGANIEYYRWAVDIVDLMDETPRNPEETDLLHWSQPSLNMRADLGPYPPGHPPIRVYIEAKDNNGLKSLAIVECTIVRPLLNDPVEGRELLIVDDTRLEADKFGPNGCPNLYTKGWPSSAELDTFLYARGNVPWRCTRTPSTGATTTPGVFAGYSFDTLGTRQGFENMTNAVRLSFLARYRHVVWMTVHSPTASTNPVDPTDPMTALRYITAPGRSNTLAAYIGLGGEVWLLGGGAAILSLVNFDKDENNSTLLGERYSFELGELVPGRMLYDAARWHSELASVTSTGQVFRSARAVGGWSHPSSTGGVVSAPDYSLLPEQMRPKSLGLGDLPPPTRSPVGQNQFYSNSIFDFEYLSEPNYIEEDVDPDPNHVRIASALDTLMTLQTSSSYNPGLEHATMTYYHGLNGPPVVFSGFAPWSFSRTDCIQLVDFVLQQIWGIARQGPSRTAIAPQAGAASQPSVQTPAQRAMQTRLPVGRRQP